MENKSDNEIFSFFQKLLIMAVFSLVFFGCLFVLVLSHPTYQVKALILVDDNSSNTRVSNIVQKLKSITLLQITLQELNYQISPGSDEFDKLHKKIFVKQVPSSNVIEITLTHNAPAEATKIVNKLVEVLIQEDVEEGKLRTQKDLDSVQKALSAITLGKKNLLSETEISRYKFLKEMEENLIKEQVSLQNLNGFSISHIRWIDRAIPILKPRLQLNILAAFGLSFLIGFVAALITGLFLLDFKSSFDNTNEK